ncbi:MAG: hypothetical protein E6767_15445 [Dysgonomonas sp.]|nr:hypothetical protein [Dysgonomonas sp.]
MDEYRKEILDKSNNIILQLSDLVIFFEDPTLMNIYLQTKIIHKLFEDNEDIDINKLDLFHLQFTTTLIELISKVKQKNERIVGMYQHEMELNNEMIEKLRQLMIKDGGFDAEKQQQSIRMSKSMRNLYTVLYNRSNEYPFTEDISSFSIKFYKDYFFESSPELLEELIAYDKSTVYRNSFAVIDKQLLLDLGQAIFAVKFFFGVKFDSMLAEVYSIQNTDIYFLYLPAKNLFLKVDINRFPYQEWDALMSKKEQTIRNLNKKNQKLEANIKSTYKYISQEISELLEEDYKVITDLDFLASLEDIDTQANILKSMLETKMI